MNRKFSQRSRREVLKAGVTSVAATAIGIPFAARADSDGKSKWDIEADVIVVGSGAAGACAALFAQISGQRVVLLEKAPIFGGTSAKSGGAYWIPNNFHMKASGLPDSEASCLAYMARYSFPHLFNREHETLGLPASIYSLLQTFYREASPTIDKLSEFGALSSMRYSVFSNDVPDQPDYGDVLGETVGIRGRALGPKKDDNTLGLGAELMRQLRLAVEAREIPIYLSKRVERILLNDESEVVGVSVSASDDTDRVESIRIRSRRAVIFCTGGFTANRELRIQHQANPIFGGCGVPTCEGDFIRIAGSVGAQLGNMGGAWRAQTILEEAITYVSVPREIWVPPGDSMILVNRYGERVVNEKRNYHDRSKVHFTWDPNTASYPNLLMFMIYDQRTADLYAGTAPIPAHGNVESHVLKGSSLQELGELIDGRLESLVEHTGGFRLDEYFSTKLQQTIHQFNQYAVSGKDADFKRGEFLYDRDYMFFYSGHPELGTDHPENKSKNKTMYPISETGPYYAVILAPVTLDTNGGPLIDTSARVLDHDGKPIPGLYAAGNCVASPAHDTYWAAGATLGLAMTFGRIAGERAANEPIKET